MDYIQKIVNGLWKRDEMNYYTKDVVVFFDRPL